MSPAKLDVADPKTSILPTIETLSVKSTVIVEAPGLPATSILPVVPTKVTRSVEPSEPVKVILPDFGSEADPVLTGNVYVVSDSGGNVTVLVFTAVT